MEYVTVDDAEVPALGIGTWRLTGAECRSAVETALDLGYRHVDTAQAYGNERDVGRAIEESDVDREEVFLTTKVWPMNASYDALLDSVEASLARLNTDYVDLLLIHWPTPHVSTAEVMDGLNAARAEGYTRHIGVSNYGLRRLRTARQESAAPILTNQVQFHPYAPKRRMVGYCQANDVLLTGYSPLGHGGLLDDPALLTLGAKYGKTPAQVALRWALQHRGVATIPKASSRAHLEENLDVFDFRMTEEELDSLVSPSKLRSGMAYLKGRLRA